MTRWTNLHVADLHQQSRSCTKSHISCGTPVWGKLIIAVAITGAAGTLLRYHVELITRRIWPSQRTCLIRLVNVSGSFVLGLITGLVMCHNAPVAVLTIAGTGFCGSYATFQHTAIFETYTHLARRHRYLAATTHAGGTLVGLTGLTSSFAI